MHNKDQRATNTPRPYSKQGPAKGTEQDGNRTKNATIKDPEKDEPNQNPRGQRRQNKSEKHSREGRSPREKESGGKHQKIRTHEKA